MFDRNAQQVTGKQLREQARKLLQQANELDGLQPFLIIHEHDYGVSGYLAWSESRLSEKAAAEILDSEFEPDRGEVLHVLDDFTLEEITGMNASVGED